MKIMLCLLLFIISISPFIAYSEENNTTKKITYIEQQARIKGPDIYCDGAASSFQQSDIPQGIMDVRFENIKKSAIELCTKAFKRNPESAKYSFLLARAYSADYKYREAIEHYEISANLNYSLSQVTLALLFEDGVGVTKDKNKSNYWKKKAIKNKAPYYELAAQKYLVGDDVYQNIEKSRLMAEKANSGLTVRADTEEQLISNTVFEEIGNFVEDRDIIIPIPNLPSPILASPNEEIQVTAPKNVNIPEK